MQIFLQKKSDSSQTYNFLYQNIMMSIKRNGNIKQRYNDGLDQKYAG